MGVSQRLVEFSTSLSFKDLPEEVVDKVKYLLLDFVGLAMRGALSESSSPVINLVSGLGKDGHSAVIGTNLLVKTEYSCLANGCFAHSLELDDVANEASLHPAVVVFPAAIAAGEMVEATGKEIITAVVVGYEIMVRLGRALNPTEHYRHGFHPTGTCGTFAAAAAAAKLFQLDKEQFLSALGIANSQAAASMEFLTDGAWTKRLHPGWAAHSGLIAALLAKEGFKGPRQPIEGKYGFLNSYSDKPSLELAEKDLGFSYLIMKTSIKPHACCRYNQSPIDAILKIVGEKDLHPKQIKKVNVALVKTALPIVAEPIEAKRNPRSIVDAQFSMPYAAAVAISRRRAFLSEYALELVNAAEIKDLMQKVTCFHDPELDAEFPQKWPCKVEIETTDGNKYQERIEYPKGDPENPLTWSELITKFKLLTTDISEVQRQKIIEQVRSFENVSVRDFSKLLLREHF